MICYLDKTFCISPNCHCERKLTDKIRQDARKWWGGPDVPIAVGYMCNPKSNCTKKVVKKHKKKD